ncbi:Serine/threonine-protein kinase lmtk3 [Bulinus truncatus]|nr:Serine/threonine-protein kinase lmtk3 [Bulinus truncatus]
MIAEVVFSVASPLILVVLLLGCLSCLFKKKGFQNFRPGDTSNAQHNPAFAVDVSDIPDSLERVTIEPLPDILSKTSTAICFRPRIVCKCQQEALLSLNTIQRHFPRNHLTYLNEMGAGWFGQVIESEASHIVDGSSKTKVVVKMLKEDATKIEQKHFMEEVSVFRCLDHVNVLSFLGQCTDILPHLVILEFSHLGNLKTHLISHRQETEKLIKKNRLASYALDVAAGLACLHRHDFVHNDLAARNCLVMSNHTVKIGDYGISDTLFKEDYYNTGRELLPIRWMAPETLVMSDGIWTSNFGDKDSDIWSFGMLLWEIFTFGELPFNNMSDETVLHKVVSEKTILPLKTDLKVPIVDDLWSVMGQCFQSAHQRPDIEVLHQNIGQIVKADTIASITDFENKWEKLVPNRPELGSRTALAGSFLTDDLSPLSDESYLLNGDPTIVMFDNQTDDDPIVDANFSLRDVTTNASLPLYGSQAQLSFEDETPSTNISNKKIPSTSPLTAEIAPPIQVALSSEPVNADNMPSLISPPEQGDGSFIKLDHSLPQSDIYSVLEGAESKTNLLANESSNNVLTLHMGDSELPDSDANTSPKYSSGEFTDFQSGIDAQPNDSSDLNISKEFSEFVSSFSDNRETIQKKTDQEEYSHITSSDSKKVERNDSGEFTDFVTSVQILNDVIPNGTSVSTPIDLLDINMVEMSDSSLIIPSESRDFINVNLVPDLSLAGSSNTFSLPEDFHFMEDLYSAPGEANEKPLLAVLTDQTDLQGMSNGSLEDHFTIEDETDLLALPEVAAPLHLTPDLISQLNKHDGGNADPGSEKVGRHDSQNHTPAVLNGFTSSNQPTGFSSWQSDVINTFQLNKWQDDSVVHQDKIYHQVQETCLNDIQHNDIEILMNNDKEVPVLSLEPDSISTSPDLNVQDDSDADISTSSSSGQEYICSERPLTPEPPAQIFATHSDIDDQTLQIVSEIYLSRGVKSPRVFEIPPLETIYEHQDMTMVEEAEEDAADVRSNSSSSEVRYDDQFGGEFEWDDLLNTESPPRQSQGKLVPSKEQSFSDWSMDLDDDPWDSTSHLANGRISNTDFLSFGSGSTFFSKQASNSPTSWPSVTGLNQTSLYSLMDNDHIDVTSPSEDNLEDSESSLSSPSVSPVSNHSMPPSAAPSLTLHSSHFLSPNNETSKPPCHNSFPSNQ